MIKIENKKTKNILYVCAAGLLIVAIIVNINLAKPNLNISSLTLGNLAFTEASGGGEASKGPFETICNVHCHIERKTLEYNYTSSANSFWANLAANIRAQVRAYLLAANGSADANVSSDIKTTADYVVEQQLISVTITIEDYVAPRKYLCRNQPDAAACTPFNPCQ